MPQVPQHDSDRGPPLTKAFAVSLLVKGVDALLEVVGGVLMLFVSPAALNQLVLRLTQHELSEDPGDLLAVQFRQAASHFVKWTPKFGPPAKVVLEGGCSAQRSRSHEEHSNQTQL